MTHNGILFKSGFSGYIFYRPTNRQTRQSDRQTERQKDEWTENVSGSKINVCKKGFCIFGLSIFFFVQCLKLRTWLKFKPNLSHVLKYAINILENDLVAARRQSDGLDLSWVHVSVLVVITVLSHKKICR